MTYSTSSNEPLPEALEEALGETVEPKQPLIPALAPKSWGFLLGGALLLGAGTWGILQLTQPPAPPATTAAPTVLVQAVTVRSQPLASTLELSGTIRPVEQAVLSTRVSGRITYFPLEAGDRFRKGDVLAQIDVADIAAQTSEAQAGVAQAQADLARAQASLSELKAQKLSTQAELELAQINQSRTARLVAEGALAQADLDAANTALKQSQERVAQADAGILQAAATITQAQAAIDQAQSGLAAAAVNESYGTVIAPFDGVVTEKLAYLGETTNPYSMNGTALLKIENPDRLQLEISVPEENLRFVQVGQPIQVRVDAVNRTFDAKIEQIVPAADPNSRSFLVKIPLTPAGSVISGMFGRVALPVEGQPETILIPESALVQRGQLQGVYVVSTLGDRTLAVLRWVKPGQQRAGQIEIVSGLVSGDRLITSNIEQLSDGQPISIQP